MSILNFRRKPKAVAPILAEKSQEDWEALYNIKCADYNALDHAAVYQAEQDADTIEELEKQLEVAHAVETSQAEVIATQKGVIENLKQEPERLASTMANIASRESSLEQAVQSLVEQRAILQELSRRAIHLLLFPRGMHQSWKVDREKLLAEYKAIGIEDE